MTDLLADTDLLDNLAAARVHHARSDPWWVSLNGALERDRERLRSELASGSVSLGPLGVLPFTLVDMGAISSTDLFGLDELIIFSFYWTNRHRYQRVVDMGANVGLHSVVLARMGFKVVAYEPDPNHVALLRMHVGQAHVQDRVEVKEAAVAEKDGTVNFVRVLGNTTGSHVAGAKADPYGELHMFEVDSLSVQHAIGRADLVKMDVEGLEASLLTCLRPQDFLSTDVLCEVGSESNAQAIWDHFQGTNVRMFSQMVGWQEVTGVEDLPKSYREGSLFISCRSEMPWGAPGGSG